MAACSLSLRRNNRLVRVVRRRETGKENDARAYHDRYYQQRDEIFFPGRPKCIGHRMRVYGLYAFNQQVSIFLDCARRRKGCSITSPREKRVETRCRP